MQLPRLRPRPMSTKTCTNFRGLDRRAGASMRHNYQAWAISWIDERNLSSDRAPMLTVRKNWTATEQIEGFPGIARIVSVSVQGDHLVILDETGTLWCNGHSFYIVSGQSGDGPSEDIRIETERGSASMDVTYFSAAHRFNDDTVRSWVNDHGGSSREHAYMAMLRYRTRDNALHLYDEASGVESSQGWTPQEIGCTMDGIPQDRDLFSWCVITESIFTNAGTDVRMVTMGAMTCIPEALDGMGIWVNTVDLAAGAEMVLGENYGSMGAETLWIAGTIELSLCDIDGNAYTGVSVSTTEPQTQSGYWLDVGGSETVLRQWRAVTSEWIKIDQPYVRIKLDGVTATANIPLIYDDREQQMTHMFRVGDTIRLKTKNHPVIDYQDIYDILNGTHYIYAVPDGDIVVAGIMDATDRVCGLLSGSYAPEAGGLIDDDGYIQAERVLPKMDYLVESENRLWGCYYGVQDGKSINEIFCSKLGDPTNWESYQGLSTDAWRASRGIAEPYTGAAVLGGCPLFFREDSLEKVYPSSGGAHQIQTFTLEGVEKGAAGSLCVIEDRLYYKSRSGAMVYTGTQPRRISDAWGDLSLIGGDAARDGRKYCLSTTTQDGERVVAVYDPSTGDWHIETEPWEGKAGTIRDTLFGLRGGKLYLKNSTGQNSAGVDWYAETDTVAFVPEHTWIYYMRFRFRLGYRQNAFVRVYIAYGDWPFQLKGTLHGTMMDTQEISIFPERKDNFRIRLEGSGDCELQSLSFRVERSEGGH